MEAADVDAQAVRFDNKLVGFGLEEVSFFGFGRGREFGDDRSRTGTDFKKSGGDKAGDYFVCGVGVDFEFAAEGANRRKVVARTELTGDDSLCGGGGKLLAEGGGRSEGHGETGTRGGKRKEYNTRRRRGAFCGRA